MGESFWIFRDRNEELVPMGRSYVARIKGEVMP